jgi:hypothetical protein
MLINYLAGRSGLVSKDLVLASNPEPPTPKPVGGEVFQVDKLALLTPYIAAILVIATAAVAIIKKRRF